MAGVLFPAILGAVRYKDKRLSESSTVLREMSHASDKGIPQDLGRKARCVVVVPNLKKIAFIGGAKYGRGFASCFLNSGVWSPPAAIRIEGGSFGLQLGGSETDVILLVMNEGGMEKLMSSKFTLGGEAGAAAGPVGRNLSANTDALMKAEILTYSRSRGVFAGLSLEGATLREDKEENAKLYGREVTDEQILSGKVPQPPQASGLITQIQQFSGKGGGKGRKGRRTRSAASAVAGSPEPMAGAPQTPVPVSPAPVAGDTSSQPAADNTARNTRDRAPSQLTADQGKNNLSDLEIERQIRRSVVSDSSLSTYAHNVKIVAAKGNVTLKGPVRSDSERSSIAARAAAVVGKDRVTNQIEIAPK